MTTSKQLGSQRIAEKSLGTRTVMNTDFGRIAYVERCAFGGAPYWVVGIVCNGINDYSETFKTKHEAFEEYEAL